VTELLLGTLHSIFTGVGNRDASFGAQRVEMMHVAVVVACGCWAGGMVGKIIYDSDLAHRSVRHDACGCGMWLWLWLWGA
jgi:hypothetical protein